MQNFITYITNTKKKLSAVFNAQLAQCDVMCPWMETQVLSVSPSFSPLPIVPHRPCV